MSLKKMSLLLLIIVGAASCKKDGYDTKNSDFQKLNDKLADEGKEEVYTLDVEVHAYTFTLAEEKNLFVIGYKSHPDLRKTDYRIEIVDNSDSSVMYSHLHQFKSNRVSYVPPTTPVTFQSGVSYTVKRIQTNWGDNVVRTIGEIIKTEEDDYPINAGIMTVSESEFTDVDGSAKGLKYFGVPQIDLVFE